MTTLTLDVITPDTLEGVDHPLEPTTVAYIQSLVEPWAAQIRAHDAETIDELIRWAQRIIPESVITPSDYALAESNVDAERNRLIQLLGLFLSIEATEYVEAIRQDIVVLPWDVEEAVGASPNAEAVAEFFGLEAYHQPDPQLPVTVTINGESFIHPMTKLMAMGLVLFSRVSDIDFAPEMFGTQFSYFDDTQTRHRYFEVPITGARGMDSITIGDKEYRLGTRTETLGFLQGFKTGAEWAGVDHRAYWSNFFHQDEHNTVTNLTF